MALTDQLVAWWDLDEASGTRADAHGTKDLTDNNTVGQESPGAGAGTGDAALFVDANDEHLSRNDDAIIPGGAGNDFAVAFWARADKTTGDDWFCGRFDGSGQRFRIGYNHDFDDLNIFIEDGSFNNIFVRPGQFSRATWHHVVVNYDDAAGQLEAFIDGISRATDTWANSPGAAGGVSFVLGSRQSGQGSLDGTLDSFAVWDRILTQTEIDELYNGGAGVSYADISGGGGTALLEVVNESVESSETSLRLRELNRIAEETLQIAEATLRPRTMARIFGEAVQTTEALLRPRTLTRLRAETIEVAEELIRARARSRTLSETVETSEATAHARGFVRVLTETVEIAESVSRTIQAQIVQVVNESIAIAESLLRTIGFVRVVSEAVETSETQLRLRSLTRILTESIEVAEAQVRIRALVRLLAETVETAEQIVRSRSLTRVTTEVMQVAENVLRALITPGVDALVAALVTIVPSLGGSPEIEPSLKGSIDIEP